MFPSVVWQTDSLRHLFRLNAFTAVTCSCLAVYPGMVRLVGTCAQNNRAACLFRIFPGLFRLEASLFGFEMFWRPICSKWLGRPCTVRAVNRAACLFRIHPGLFRLEASLFGFVCRASCFVQRLADGLTHWAARHQKSQRRRCWWKVSLMHRRVEEHRAKLNGNHDYNKWREKFKTHYA